MGATQFAVGLPRYGRRPPVRLLPPLERRTRWRALRDSFLVRFVVALPDGPVEAAWALLEPARKAWWLLVRLWAGPGMRGGWESDAGRLLLAVHGAYWTREGVRADEANCYVRVTDEGVVAVRAKWVDVGEEFGRVHAGVRGTPRLRALRRRVDIGFPDGSWLTVRTLTPGAAELLREVLEAEVPRGAGAAVRG
ncbi:hypothetical protein GCM10017562_64310 [Streptomyces roseofulvus]|uniref:Uncharacterized protein n=2 Tax=Streptomyces TaxID=1883 RepID=A0ABU4K8V2_9ACTN|nr:hypothetical protein [Streptomyces roseolus]MDX2294178.1 hypothetical protein [Streptomyces roseolus]